jgi:hypothetical protein
VYCAARLRTWRVARLYSVLYSEISSISESVQNRTHAHIHIFAYNGRYYYLPEYWPFLLGHPIRIYRGGEKIIETLRNWGIEFFCIGYIERTAQHRMFFRLFTLCSAHVSALMIVLSDRPCERIGKWETCPILKEDIVGALLAGASMIKTATLWGVSRAAASNVMSVYTNHGKTTSANRHNGRNSTVTERDLRISRRIVQKGHKTTAAQVTGQQNWIFILKTLFPQKLSDMSFTNPTSTVGLQLLNLWVPKVMLRCVNNGVTTIKFGYPTTWNTRMIW